MQTQDTTQQDPRSPIFTQKQKINAEHRGMFFTCSSSTECSSCLQSSSVCVECLQLLTHMTYSLSHSLLMFCGCVGWGWSQRERERMQMMMRRELNDNKKKSKGQGLDSCHRIIILRFRSQNLNKQMVIFTFSITAIFSLSIIFFSHLKRSLLTWFQHRCRSKCILPQEIILQYI